MKVNKKVWKNIVLCRKVSIVKIIETKYFKSSTICIYYIKNIFIY